jgi:uncharacterized protein involved in exopolysaccharide biosynthesis
MNSAGQLFRTDLRKIISIGQRWWKHIVVITLGAFLLAVVVTMPRFMPPLFKSTAVLYPANLFPFSTESPTEQLIQILKSEDIRAMAIRDFNLMQHYGIPADARFPMTRLYGIYDDYVRVKKTQLESIELTVLDTDPMIAYRLCDSLISYMNQKVRAIHRDKNRELVVIWRNQLNRKKAEMDSMEAAIHRLRTDYGILEFEEQIEPFATEYYKALAAGKAGDGHSKLDKIERNLAEKGGEYISLKEHLWRVRGAYNDYKKEYEAALRNLEKEQTYAHIVTPPRPAERKSYPLRMLIVLGTTVAAFFFSLILVMVLENLRFSEQ